MAEALYQETPEETAEETAEETTQETQGEPQGEPEAQEEGTTISSISELVEHLQADPEWMNGLKVPVKVDGQPAETTLSELVSNYQIGRATQARLDESKSVLQNAKQEAARLQSSIKEEAGKAAGLVMLAKTLFAQSKPDESLRDSDPTQYLIQSKRFEEQQRAIQTAESQIAQTLKQYMNQGPSSEALQEERNKLLEKFDYLADEKKASVLGEYILSQGFTPQDLEQTADHRLFVLAEKARLYDESKQKTDTAKKKVAVIPKVMKPGSAQQKTDKPKDAATILYGSN